MRLHLSFEGLIVKALCSILLLFACSFAYAEKDFAVSLGAGGATVQAGANDAFGKDVNFRLGEGFAGIRYKWIGIEQRIGRGLMGETIKVGEDPDSQRAITQKTAIDSYATSYLRLQFDNDIARIYGLYGQTVMSATSESSTTGFRDIESEGDSYGLGVGIRINKAIHFNVEARQFISNELDSIWGISFNIDIAVISL
ncbi:MAG: hypothetical protein ACI93R_002663 [Flavobacteriales bacterium]|jgi:hypothetical protein